MGDPSRAISDDRQWEAWRILYRKSMLNRLEDILLNYFMDQSETVWASVASDIPWAGGSVGRWVSGPVWLRNNDGSIRFEVRTFKVGCIIPMVISSLFHMSQPYYVLVTNQSLAMLARNLYIKITPLENNIVMGTLEIQWAWNFLKIAGNLNRTSGVEFKPAWRKIPKQSYSTTRFWLCPLQDFIYFFKIKQTIKVKIMKKNSKLCLKLKSVLLILRKYLLSKREKKDSIKNAEICKASTAE